MEEAVAAYISTAAAKMRKEKLRATGANVYFEYYPEYESGNKHNGGVLGTTVTFDRPTGDTGEMLNKISPVLPMLFSKDRRYKKAGVVFYGFEGAEGKHLDLFDAPVSKHSDELYAAIDNINQLQS